MNAYEIIMKKRDGNSLDEQEIRYLVKGFTSGDIPEYQMSAWLMAVWYQGMNDRERGQFTRAMIQTGKQHTYPSITGPLVDKHSTGGVGDGVSLSLVPLVASFGVPIPMMSGRGLGHTGGTLDKLESIPGFRVSLDGSEVETLLERVGAAFLSQTDDIVPADRELYALRDVTATVDSVDLISSSIMSKKIAEGMDALILDVKTGSGAFMKQYDRALELARAMIGIGREHDRRTRALITDMDQPLGRAVGNALEMKQAIRVLRGEGPADLTELVCRLAGEMLFLGERAEDPEAGYEKSRQRLHTGEPLDKLREIMEAQDGDPAVLEDLSRFPSAENTDVIHSPDAGFVGRIDAFQVGMASNELGAGRTRRGDTIDPAVGVVLEKKVGETVEPGEPLGRLEWNQQSDLESARERFLNAFSIVDREPERRPLVFASVDQEGTEHRLNYARPPSAE